MKICHFSPPSALTDASRLGILLEKEQILDVNLLWSYHYQRQGYYNYRERAQHLAPPSLSALLTLKPEPLALLQQTLELADRYGQEACTLFPLKETRLHAPLDQITTYRDFYAHEKHVAKGFSLRNEPIPPAWYEIPAYYKGSPHGFIGPEEEILWPRYSRRLDYELELAAVVGRDGRNLTEREAKKYLFGLTILNDISARDMQKKEMAIRLGPAKAKDFCSVIGPVITTMDEFPNWEESEPDLTMIARINGEEWSRGQSGAAHYNFAQMIAHVSQDEWVLAGDLLGSGTVGGGCGLELSRWIQPGDEIELEVEGIGTLRNKVGRPQEEKKGDG